MDNCENSKSFFFKYCADMDNCENSKSFDFICIYRLVKKYSLYLCFAFYKLGQRLFFKKQLGQRFKKQQALIIRTILLIIIQLNANKKTSLW